MRRRDEQGFSLIEVMIAMGVMAALAYGYASQMIYQSKVARTADSRMDVADLKTSISILLAQDATCLETLGGKKVGDSTQVIKKGVKNYSDPGSPWTFTDVYQTGGDKPASPSVQIESMTLGGNLPPGNTGLMTLTLTLKHRKEVTGPSVLTRDIPIKATLDNDGKITECRSSTGVAATGINCSDPATQCLKNDSYCSGQIYVNTEKDCACTGAHVGGTDANGFKCKSADGKI